MTKYEQIMEKIQTLKNLKANPYPYYNFTPSELELMEEALETIQFLEIIFKKRARNNKLENHV